MAKELLAPNGKPSNLTPAQYKLVRTPAFKKWFGDWENDPANASKVVDENGEPLVVYRGMPKKRRFGNIFNYNVNLFIENRKKNKFAFYFSRTKEEAEIYGFQSAEYNDDDYIVKEYFLKINNLFLAVKKDSVASKSKININSSRPNRFNLYDKPIPEIDKELGKGYLTFKELFDLAKPNKKDFELLNTEYTDNEDAKKEYEEEQERVSAKPIYWHFIDISKNDKKQDFWRNYLKDIKKYDGLMFYEDTHALTFTGRGKNEKAILQFLDNPNTICVFEPNQIKLADGTNTKFDNMNPDIRYANGGMMYNGGLLAPNGHKTNLTLEQYKLVRTPEFKEWFGDWENDPENSSKVIDDNGEPLVVYHGTNKKFNIFKINERTPYSFFAKNKEYAETYTDDEYSVSNPKMYECFLNIRTPLDTSKNYEFNNESLYLYYFLTKLIYKDVKEGKIILPQRYYLDNKKEELKEFIENQNTKFGSVFWFLLRKDGNNYNDYLKGYNKEYAEKNKKKKRGFLKNFLQYLNYDGVVQYENVYGEEVKVNYKKIADKEKDYASLVFAVFNSNQIKLADGTNTTFDSNNDDIRFEQGGITESSTPDYLRMFLGK